MPNENSDVSEALRALGFRTSREALAALFIHATKSRMSPTESVEQLIALERRERDARNLARRTKLATLGSVPPRDGFDWAHPRKIEREMFERLLEFDFVEAGHNVLLRGPSGVGKTTLAQTLGLEALKRGFTVRFSTLADVLGDLLRQESLPAMERRLRRYTRPDLLVLDEIGYLPCDSRAADLLYNVITRRHQKRSTVITTNLPFKQWGSIFPGAACVAALVDRFTENCFVLDIEGDSWRQKPARPAAVSTATLKKTRPR